MQVQCPSCQKALNAPDSMAGRVVKCPGCGGQMQLPAGPATAGPAGQPPPAADREVPGPTKPCPFCREPIQAAAVKCRHCGEMIDPRRRKEMALAQVQVNSYQTGMKVMGGILIVLGVLVGIVALVAGAALAAFGALAGVIMVMLGGIALLYLVFGFCAVRCHNWANWATAILAGLSLLLNVLSLVNREETTKGVLIGLAINVALVVLAIRNILKHGQVVRAGLDPRMGLGGAGRTRIAGRSRTARPAAGAGARLRSRVRR
jgi:uncharacterized membrane protein (DUF2068 family)